MVVSSYLTWCHELFRWASKTSSPPTWPLRTSTPASSQGSWCKAHSFSATQTTGRPTFCQTHTMGPFSFRVRLFKQRNKAKAEFLISGRKITDSSPAFQDCTTRTAPSTETLLPSSYSRSLNGIQPVSLWQNKAQATPGTSWREMKKKMGIKMRKICRRVTNLYQGFFSIVFR